MKTHGTSCMTLAALAALLSTSVFAGDAATRDWSEIYLAESPSVSPDGSFFVFAWCGRIWRAPTAGGTAFPLTDGKSNESCPCVSPDGRKVAFLSDRTGTSQLFEVELGEDGLTASSLRQVTFHTQSLTPYGYTADGAYMVAAGYRDHASESVTNMRISRRAFLVPMCGRAAEELLFDAPANAPAVSPDGKKVLFVVHDDGDGKAFRKRSPRSASSKAGHIWLYDRETGEFSPVVTGDVGAYSPVWMPDGRSFVYVSGDVGVRNVWQRGLFDNASRQLTDAASAREGDNVLSLSVSRDGRTLVFERGFDFWRMDLSAEKPVAERIALRPAGVVHGASREVRRKYTTMDNNYGDGNCTFAVASNAVDAAFTAGGDLWAMSMDDESREPVLVHGGTRTHERDCCFTADGGALYYLSDRGDGADVWRAVRADADKPWSAQTGFARTRLTSGDAVCRRNLSVSPDGRLLAWTDATGRFSFADTNAVVRHVSPVQSCDVNIGYDWSPDGRYVVASQMDGYGNKDVWIIPTSATDDDGKPTPAPCNVSRNHKWDGGPAWSPDGRVIVFSGVRTATGNDERIFYAYLDPEDEAHETAGKGVRKEPCRVDLEGLPDRVRATGASGCGAFFAPDSRTIGFCTDHKSWKMKVGAQKDKEAAKPKETFGGKRCFVCSWCKTKDGEKILTVLDGVPAKGDKQRKFTVYQKTDVADYQELAFLTAWADLRDNFCDPMMHGADWPAVREKYLAAARNAPSWGVFARAVRMMLGEIDASHLGFWAGDRAKGRWLRSVSNNGWTEVTAHVGARFDAAWKGEGWRVRDVIPDSPADRGKEGLLPGDVVLSVDGRAVRPGMDYSEAMNTALPHKFRLVVRREGEKYELVRELEAISFPKARSLLRAAEVAAARKNARAKGNFGYLAVDAMRDSVADEFTDDVFAECFGKDGVVIDVRFNGGGHTTDRLLDILCGNRHCRTLYRGSEDESYLLSRYKRPVITTLPVVAIANERSQSCAEEFSHAMQTLGRAKVVGVATAGAVIGTPDVRILDYGEMKRPHVGFFLPDGTDMEWNGAKPDVEVELTPADVAAGRDPQMDAALEVLAKEAEVRRANPPPPLKFSRW